MAENDIELSVGIKLDEAQFVNEYQSKLSKLSKATQTQIQGAMDEISGPAVKQWGPLPFAGMHDSNSGNAIATQAFLSSLSRDLQGAGYSGTPYESALINATYRSSMSDPMQRYHRMLAMGLTQQADLTHPDTALGKTIETDYALMSQPWSRDFIKTTNYRGQKRSYVDFAGMREYAVEAGLGRWIDEDGYETADNFELISDELENIEEKADKSGKTFREWGDSLKSVLGTLTAIGALGGLVGAAIKLNAKAEQATIEAGGTLDKRRAFIGMSALDELRTKVASKAVGLGENAIKDEIYSMSESIEEYKMFGQGDALPPALLGIFDNLMKSDDPYEVYKQAADEIYKELKGADPAKQRNWLMLMNKAGLGSMSSLVGQFLSNPDYAKTYKTPSKAFDLEDNPYYSVYSKAELLTPQIAKLNESLRTSYNQMATDWENTFGLKFKGWWDDVMKTKIVPWFQEILNFMAPDDSNAGGARAELSLILLHGDRDRAIQDAIKKDKTKTIADFPGYKGYSGAVAGNSDWGNWIGGHINYQTGSAAQNSWFLFKRIADTPDEELNKISDVRQRAAQFAARNRIRYMMKRLDAVGLANIFSDSNYDLVDKYLGRALQSGAYDGSEGWQTRFDTYIDRLLSLGTGGKTDDKVVSLLEQIAANTEIAAEVRNDAKFWELVELSYGPTQANEWRQLLNKQ